MRGELDWIAMKALDKDRNRRYETANGFALDILRYLADEAVQACPPSAAYRFRKFARRNKRAVATTALLLLVVLAGAQSQRGRPCGRPERNTMRSKKRSRPRGSGTRRGGLAERQRRAGHARAVLAIRERTGLRRRPTEDRRRMGYDVQLADAVKRSAPVRRKQLKISRSSKPGCG